MTPARQRGIPHETDLSRKCRSGPCVTGEATVAYLSRRVGLTLAELCSWGGRGTSAARCALASMGAHAREPPSGVVFLMHGYGRRARGRDALGGRRAR